MVCDFEKKYPASTLVEKKICAHDQNISFLTLPDGELTHVTHAHTCPEKNFLAHERV